jgi:hypothetical protein
VVGQLQHAGASPALRIEDTMTLETAQKEQFRRAYVQAGAAAAGFAWSSPSVDDDSVDVTLAARSGSGTVRSPKLDLQLKCHAHAEFTQPSFIFPLKVKNYDELRDTAVMVPRLLPVSIWTKDADDGPLEVLLPLDTSKRDYALRMGELLQTLAISEGRSQKDVYADLLTTCADLVRIRLDDPELLDGTLPIKTHAIVAQKVRDLLLAAACSALSRRPVWHNPMESSSSFIPPPSSASYSVLVVNAKAGGLLSGTMNDCGKVLDTFTTTNRGEVKRIAAQTAMQVVSRGNFISSDPPCYDNIAFADLSDFYHVWLRRSPRDEFSNLLTTFAVPKAEELVATPYSHATQESAEKFFLDGMSQAMHNLALHSQPAAP